MLLVPTLADRRDLTLEDLVRLDEPAVIFEYTHVDSDGVTAYVYTVAGWLDGHNVAVDAAGKFRGGCTVGGDAIIVHQPDRATADEMATQGLQDTIDAVRANAGRKGRELSIEAALRPVLRH